MLFLGVLNLIETKPFNIWHLFPVLKPYIHRHISISNPPLTQVRLRSVSVLHRRRYQIVCLLPSNQIRGLGIFPRVANCIIASQKPSSDKSEQNPNQKRRTSVWVRWWKAQFQLRKRETSSADQDSVVSDLWSVCDDELELCAWSKDTLDWIVAQSENQTD